MRKRGGRIFSSAKRYLIIVTGKKTASCLKVISRRRTAFIRLERLSKPPGALFELIFRSLSVLWNVAEISNVVRDEDKMVQCMPRISRLLILMSCGIIHKPRDGRRWAQKSVMELIVTWEGSRRLISLSSPFDTIWEEHGNVPWFMDDPAKGTVTDRPRAPCWQRFFPSCLLFRIWFYPTFTLMRFCNARMRG